MTRLIKVDFYKVVLPDDAQRPFEQIIETIASSPEDQTRNLQRDANPVRLNEAESGSDLWEGEMIRIRMDEVPVKANLEGDISPIGLEEDEGIGEETAFLYHIPTEILGLQRNRYAVSPSGFAWYFEEKGGITPIELEPILREDAIQRLAQMDEVRKLNLHIAGVENMNVFRGLGRGVKGMMTLMDEFGSPNLNVNVSMGRRSGSLVSSTVKSVAKQLARLSQRGETTVRKVEITGRDEDGEKTILDLIEYRMVEAIPVELDPDRTVSRQKRRAAIRTAWRARKQELLRMFSS